MAKVTLDIINSFEKISISDYLELYEIIIQENVNPLEKELQILSMLSGKPVDFFNHLEMETVGKLLDQIKWVYMSPNASVQDEYTLMNGKKVKFIRDLNKLTVGQMIDLMTYKKEEKTEADKLKNLGNVLTAICLPIKKNKRGKEVTEKYLETPKDILAEEYMNQMKIEDACGISLFFFLMFGLFSTIGKEFLLMDSQMKLKSALKKLKTEQKIPKKKILELEKRMKEVFTQDGDGLA